MEQSDSRSATSGKPSATNAWGKFGQLITQAMATLGLLSLFDESIDWAPIFKHAIHVYRSLVYPIIDWLTFPLPNPVPPVWKDYFTANSLVFASFNTATAGEVRPRTIATITWSSFLEAGQQLVGRIRERSTLLPLTLVKTVLGALAFIWFLAIVIALSWAIYLLLLIHLTCKFLKQQTPEDRQKRRAELVRAVYSLIQSFYMFIAILGINYAVGLTS